ncbi:MAG: SGNH/GDSL hydrolase family protein [Clostridia bacterium]|nr:SGNH/GDSL hydrolase family protein [Clostridia bacterium]
MDIKRLKINFLGDSITEGSGASDPAVKGYVGVIAERYAPVAARNYGIGGTRIAPQRGKSESERWDLDFIMRAKEMDRDADLVCVFGGTNDYGHGDAPFGSFGDETADTFCGSCDVLFRYLTEAYAGKQLMVMTPLKREGENNPRFDGHILSDFAEIIKKTAAKYAIPVLDLYNESGICPDVEANKLTYTADGLHPNDFGHSYLADKVAGFIKSL